MTLEATLRTQYRVSDFVGWYRDGSLLLNPDFQRRSVWNKAAKSYFIDTLLKGFPVPIIFLRDMRSSLDTYKSGRDVVDGQQRIRTILSFVDPRSLPDFKAERDDFAIDKSHNKELAGKRFADLDASDQQNILDYQFSVHSFPADTDDRLILQIFARMNSTGYKLNPQELRNAEFYRAFKTLAYDVATEQLHRWREWKIMNADAIARMKEAELTSELLMFISHGEMDKNQTYISRFYKHYDDEYPYGEETARRFRITFDAIEELFGKTVIAKLFRTKTMFYALFVTIYGLQFGLRAPVRIPKEPPTLSRVRATRVAPDVVESIKRAASNIKQREAPAEILSAARGATADASQRKLVVGYLAGEDNDPCRHLP